MDEEKKENIVNDYYEKNEMRDYSLVPEIKNENKKAKIKYSTEIDKPPLYFNEFNDINRKGSKINEIHEFYQNPAEINYRHMLNINDTTTIFESKNLIYKKDIEVKVIIKIEVEAGVEIVDIINCLCFIFWKRDENIYNQI